MKSSDNVTTPEIVFCDNHLLVAVKPAGYLTQPNETGAPSLEAYAKEWVKQEFKKPGAVFLHCIHRLDRPVSGLVLFAKTSKALSRLNEQSRAQEIQRVYTAEIEGILAEKVGRLEHYLIHAEHRALIGKANDPEAKKARLTFEVLHYLERSTIVKIELETGRYHQIRAQFSTIGHPIVGDQRYGSRTGDGQAIHLHCGELSLQHPVSQEILRFHTPAPFA